LFVKTGGSKLKDFLATRQMLISSQRLQSFAVM